MRLSLRPNHPKCLISHLFPPNGLTCCNWVDGLNMAFPNRLGLRPLLWFVGYCSLKYQRTVRGLTVRCGLMRPLFLLMGCSDQSDGNKICQRNPNPFVLAIDRMTQSNTFCCPIRHRAQATYHTRP